MEGPLAPGVPFSNRASSVNCLLLVAAVVAVPGSRFSPRSAYAAATSGPKHRRCNKLGHRTTSHGANRRATAPGSQHHGGRGSGSNGAKSASQRNHQRKLLILLGNAEKHRLMQVGGTSVPARVSAASGVHQPVHLSLTSKPCSQVRWNAVSAPLLPEPQDLCLHRDYPMSTHVPPGRGGTVPASTRTTGPGSALVSSIELRIGLNQRYAGKYLAVPFYVSKPQDV